MIWTEMPNGWTILMFIVAAAVGWGTYKTIIARLVRDFDELAETVERHIEDTIKKREEAISEAKRWGCANFVTKENYEPRHSELERRVADLNTVDWSARLTAIEVDMKHLNARVGELVIMMTKMMNGRQ